MDKSLFPFIPVRLLQTMGIDEEQMKGGSSILGIERDLTVAFLCGGNGIRTGHSWEDVKVENPFALINHALTFALPAIWDNNGAIEDFKEETFRAVFNVHPEDALKASIDICEAVTRSGESSRRLAIALTYGKVSMGVVGYEYRMSIISLSPVTRLAEVLQKKAHDYSAKILVTGALAEEIPNFATRYNQRLLGVIHRRDIGIEEKLYDVFDGDELEVRNLKRRTKTLFERGIKLFLERKFSEARGCFIEVLKADRSDRAARHYLFLCDTNYNLEPAEREAVNVYLEEF